MTEAQSATLARQSAALFDSLRQLHALMTGPRAKELSPRSTGVGVGAAGGARLHLRVEQAGCPWQVLWGAKGTKAPFDLVNWASTTGNFDGF